MANNDQIILDRILEQQRKQRSPSASKSNFFESYVVEQVLKDADLSDEEIESGLVGDVVMEASMASIFLLTAI
jgi:hypothetical protein